MARQPREPREPQEKIVLRKVQGSIDHFVAFLNDWGNQEWRSEEPTYRVLPVRKEPTMAWWDWGMAGSRFLCGGIKALERPDGETCAVIFSLYSKRGECESGFRGVVKAITAEMEAYGFLPDDTDRYKYVRPERLSIVLEYRRLRAQGRITNQDAWAQANYGITGRTLREYRREFE